MCGEREREQDRSFIKNEAFKQSNNGRWEKETIFFLIEQKWSNWQKKNDASFIMRSVLQKEKKSTKCLEKCNIFKKSIHVVLS